MPFAAMIKCPDTGELVNTSFVFGDKRMFENPGSRLEKNSVTCPYCRKEHLWSKDDAILVEASEASA